MAVPVSLVVSSGLLLVSSAYVSTRLLFVATFAVSYIFLERVLTPELVDGFFREVDAVVLGDLRDVRDAIRNEPRTSPIYAAAEERVRRARAFVADAIGSLETKARARTRLSGVKDAATAAFLWLRLAAGVANLGATVLTTTAIEEARSRAPKLLRWRGVKGLRTPSPNDPPESKKDTTLLVAWIAAIVAYCAQVVTLGGICSSIATFGLCLPCFAALCGFALMEAERVYLWGSYEIDTTGSSYTANPRPPAGDAAGGGGGVKEKDLQDAWGWLCLLTIVMHWIDALLIAYMLGKRPFVLASLAIYNVAALKAARQAYLTADDADGEQGNVNRWCCAALKVLTIDVAKVVATYLAIDLYLGALLFVPLGAKAAFLLTTAIKRVLIIRRVLVPLRTSPEMPKVLKTIIRRVLVSLETSPEVPKFLTTLVPRIHVTLLPTTKKTRKARPRRSTPMYQMQRSSVATNQTAAVAAWTTGVS